MIREVGLWEESHAATVWSLVMRAKGYVQAAILAGLAYGTCLTSPTAFLPGIGTAQAKEFYTRKRVHGRWVSGRFPKRHAYRAERRHEARAETAPRRTVALPPLTRPERETRDELRAQVQPSEAPPREERLVKLQRALEARAQAIATASEVEVTSSVRPLEISSQRPRSEPRSVSFDFETGLKTTTFVGGFVVREGFDIGTLKGLAAPLPGNENLASARP